MMLPFHILMLSIAPITAAQAGDFGKLFFTPQQRTQLEHEHAKNTRANEDAGSSIRLNGIVQRSDGNRTIWINGVAQTASCVATTPDRQALNIPGASRPVALKVGQRVPAGQ